MEEDPTLDYKDRLPVIDKIGMYLTRSIKIDEADDEVRGIAGSAVRKYSNAFKPGRASRGKARDTGSATYSTDYDDDEGAAPLFSDGGDE